jgi:predicted TIM-barrel fold metal-dependent hydrolase
MLNRTPRCWPSAECALTRGIAAAWLSAAAIAGLAAASEPGDPLDGADGRPLALENFRPKSQLRVPRTELRGARFAAVDVHVHPRIRFRHQPALLDDFVRVMDEQNVALCVSLDGGMGDDLEEHLAYLAPHAGRFVVFATIDWRGDGRDEDPASWDCHRSDFARRTAARLAEAKRRGVVGLKLFKDLGLGVRNADGSLVAVDDPRWDPIWDAAGGLGLPVIMHVGDPLAFFEPIDAKNERWEELRRHPDWSFHGLDPRGRPWPTHAELLAAFQRVVERHPNTNFIAAHLGNLPEDLAALGAWLDRAPNLAVDLSSRIAELGRQPYSARRFLVRYQDRVLWGSDGPRPAARLDANWRFLETRDEYFSYAETPFPPQGLWWIDGVGLPDTVLRKVYCGNAQRLIPGVTAKLAALRKSGWGRSGPVANPTE